MSCVVEVGDGGGAAWLCGAVVSWQVDVRPVCAGHVDWEVARVRQESGAWPTTLKVEAARSLEREGR